MDTDREDEQPVTSADDDAAERDGNHLDGDDKQILDLSTEDEVTGGARVPSDYDYGDRSLG